MLITQFETIKEKAAVMSNKQLAEMLSLPYNTVKSARLRHNLPIFNPRKKPPGPQAVVARQEKHVVIVPKKFDGPVEAAKMLRVFTIIEALCKGPVSITGLAIMIDSKTRTVYRYLTLITALGGNLELEKGRYYLKECPLCGKNKL